MATGRIKITTLLVICGGVFLIDSLGRLLHTKVVRTDLLVLAGLRAVEIAFILFAAGLLEHDITVLGISRSRIWPGIKRGLLWTAGFGAVTGIVFLGLVLVKQNPFLLIQTRLPASPMDRLLFFGVGGIIGPVAEEFFFRGTLYSFFRRWGIFPAILISTLLFAFLHRSVAPLPLVQLIGGLLFAAAFEIEKNLVVPMMIHIIGNLSIFTISLLTL